jgi:hypothetical protein
MPPTTESLAGGFIIRTVEGFGIQDYYIDIDDGSLAVQMS